MESMMVDFVSQVEAITGKPINSSQYTNLFKEICTGLMGRFLDEYFANYKEKDIAEEEAVLLAYTDRCAHLANKITKRLLVKEKELINEMQP